MGCVFDVDCIELRIDNWAGRFQSKQKGDGMACAIDNVVRCAEYDTMWSFAKWTSSDHHHQICRPHEKGMSNLAVVQKSRKWSGRQGVGLPVSCGLHI